MHTQVNQKWPLVNHLGGVCKVQCYSKKEIHDHFLYPDRDHIQLACYSVILQQDTKDMLYLDRQSKEMSE